MKHFTKSVFHESVEVLMILYRIMIPAIVVVKILEELGAIEWISWLLGPIMESLGLPASMGIVWAAAMLTNIYAGLILFYPLALTEPLTVAQVTVLSILILSAHSLPVEVRVAQRAGIRVAVTLLFRIGSALLLAALLHVFYQSTGMHGELNQLLWQPELRESEGLWDWTVQQLYYLFMVAVLVCILITLMRLLRVIGVERLMEWLLQPLLRFLGIGRAATSVTIVGMTLGLSFGGGILIREVERGHIPRRDIFSSIMLLGICHSLIEDTLLLMLIGAQSDGILWARLLFSLVLIAGLSRLYRRIPDAYLQRFILLPPVKKTSNHLGE